MFFVGYNADGTKRYYDTNSSKISFSEISDEEPQINVSEVIKPKTLEEEFLSYGFTAFEVANMMFKINNIGNLQSTVSSYTVANPTTGATTVNTNGSLVSNSALSIKNNTEYQKARLETEKAKISAISASNEIQKKQLDMMDYNLLMQGQMYEQLLENNANLKAQTEAIKAQKFIGGDTSVNVDLTSLAEANNKIAEGVQNQIETNSKITENLTKKNEHLDYLKDGLPNLRNSKGEVIKPREVDAKNKGEQHIYKEAVNTYDHSKNTLEVLNAVHGISGNDSGTAEDALAGLLNRLVEIDISQFKPEQDLKIYGVNSWLI